MAYKLLRNGVVRLADGAVIPEDLRNMDWVEFLRWLADGNVPQPQDPAPAPMKDQIDAQAARQYAKLTALRGMSPAEVSAWVDANINNLADAKDALKTICIAISILARHI